jgi:two-component system, NtrC family, response regulator AtoC
LFVLPAGKDYSPLFENSKTENLSAGNAGTAGSNEVRLLAVGREPSVLRLLWSLEEANSWQLETAANGWDAMERVQSGPDPHLLVLDVPRGESDSLPFLRWLRRLKTDLPVVLLCYPDEVAQAREVVRKGVGEILARPFDAKQLEFVIRRQLSPAGNGEEEMLNRNIEPLGPDSFFVSASLIMQKLRAQAALMAKTDVPVLVLGERGAGKYTFASLIHSLSVRSGFKLRRINCAQMPDAVLEQFFDGEASHGVFAGEKGTLFFDEITALPAALQSRLLQLLQNEEARTPAGSETGPGEARILAASSVDIDRALAEKRLREDLYYRLSAFTVHVPPLRQRKDEISILLRYFMHKLARHYSLPPRTYSAAVLDSCQRYNWPGNLKEMETFVKRYLVAGDQEPILPGMSTLTEASAAAPQTVRWTLNPAEPQFALAQIQARQVKETRPESLKSLIQGIKSEAEQNAIRAALKTTGWNRKAAARLLRVSYRTLLYKIEQYQMRAPEPYLSSLPAGELLGYEEVKGNGKAS